MIFDVIIFLRPTATRRRHFLVFSKEFLYFPRPYRNQAPSFSCIFRRILVFSQALPQPGAVIFFYFPKNFCIFTGPTATRRRHFLVFSHALPQPIILLYFPENSCIFTRPTATRRRHFLVFSEDLLYFHKPYRIQAPSFSCIFRRILVSSYALPQPGAIIFSYRPALA